MRISQELEPTSYSIRSFNSNHITVLKPVTAGLEPGSRGQTLSNSFVIMPKHLITDWPVKSVSELTDQHLAELEQYKPELVLLGTGSHQIFPDIVLLSRFSARGIGLEVMDTPAACRTYNILMHEGRHVAAAIMQHNDESL